MSTMPVGVIPFPSIPTLSPTTDTMTAAFAYGKAGLYIGPSAQSSKNPGSVLGKQWQHQTFTDAQTIAATFAGTDHGVFLHCGRSGLVVLDVDRPELVPADWWDILDGAPFQSTRTNVPRKGHYLFRVPPGRVFGNPVFPWGEIRGSNGVIMLAPTRHEKAAEGGRYLIVRGGVPPVLPDLIAQTLPTGAPGQDSATDAAVSRFREACSRAEAKPWLMGTVLERFERDSARSRHCAAVDVACQIARESAAGLYSATAAFDTLEAMFTAKFSVEERRKGRGSCGEWSGIVSWAVGQLTRARIEEVRVKHPRPFPVPGTAVVRTGEPGVDETTESLFEEHEESRDDEQVTGSMWARMGKLSPEFWDSRPVLGVIRDSAHARLCSPEVVLHCVLARMSAMLPARVKADAGMGPTALNFFTILVGPSGTGKTQGAKLGRTLVPSAGWFEDERNEFRDSAPLGSGEGISEMFMGVVDEPTGEVIEKGSRKGEPKTRPVRKQVRGNALIYVDEGQTLEAIGGRQGSVLGTTIRSAWCGETLGQTNASADRNRLVEADSYNIGMIVGWQPGASDYLFSEALGGTPQRFMFAPAVDPDMPDDVEVMIGALVNLMHLPEMLVDDPIIRFPRDVMAELRRARLAVSRGEAEIDEMDSHRALHLIKNAALLALLDLRTTVNEQDWYMAAEMWEASCRLRDWMRGTIEQRRMAEAQQKQDAAVRVAVMSAESIAAAAESRTDKAIRTAAAAIVRHLEQAGGQMQIPGRAGLKQKLNAKQKQIMGDVLEWGENEELFSICGDVVTLVVKADVVPLPRKTS